MTKPRGKPFAKGNKLGGRPEGSENIAKRLRRIAMESLDKVGDTDYFVKVAKDHPNVYIGFVSKFIPSESHLHQHDEASDNLEELLAQLKDKK